MAQSIEKQITQLLQKSNKILVLPSSPIDGDSLGSAIALYMVLRKLGKEVTVVCSESVPEVFQFLPNTKIVGSQIMATKDFIITVDAKDVRIKDLKHEIEGNKINIIITPEDGQLSEDNVAFNKGSIEYDMIITVDCAELTQLRGIYERNTEMFHQLPVVNIDHHISNTHFGKINYVQIMASATTELLLSLFKELASEEGKELIDEDVATLLLTGIITDTGSFQNANTTPRAFAIASELVGYGARQQEIIQHVYKTKQLTQLKLWGRVLSKIQVDDTYRLVWSVVSTQDFQETGSNEDETGDIIDELMTNAPGAEVVFLMKEKASGEINVSLRTTLPSVDAAKIAETFGGGGHTQAAGFRLQNIPLREAEAKVLTAIKAFQENRLHHARENVTPQEEVIPEPAPPAPEAPAPEPVPQPAPQAPAAPPEESFPGDTPPEEPPSKYKFEE